MPMKYTLSYREVHTPIADPITKFGGQPVWIEAPQWPLSRQYGTPMQFIGQITLYANLFGDLEARMAYLFLTDWTYEGMPPATDDPDGGENAVILQPGGIWRGPSLPLYEGPSLYQRTFRNGCFEETPCEYAVDLRLGEDPETGAWDEVDPDDREAMRAYLNALSEDKIGGTPVPNVNSDPRLAPGPGEWPLLLQLDSKDDSDEFFLNLGPDGVGYAFLAPDGRSGKFLWSR